MNRSEYLMAVNEFFYQGEVMGEAHLGLYVALEQDPVRRYKWATLLQLETETKARLRPFLMQLGLSLAQEDMRDKIAPFAEPFGSKSCRQHMKEIADITDFFLGKFREIEAAAPEHEKEMARSMIEHESAIHKFARLELDGDDRHSLDAVIAQLHWPLTAATGTQ